MHLIHDIFLKYRIETFIFLRFMEWKFFLPFLLSIYRHFHCLRSAKRIKDAKSYIMLITHKQNMKDPSTHNWLEFL